ncbi:hypothetical protein [Bradyrhizobium sp. WSM3983]|uniref:hypothetical protein n=1 Tax=Bradyrhizobium sp. WSM3983 TaxID=1038867 RepID=UPI0012EB4D86|nr:hypothetical protein [Bradyrhizobium sp. WSM3983]
MPSSDHNPAPISPVAFLRAALKSSPSPNDRDLVASIVNVRATLAQGTDVDKAFLTDPNNVGYLKRSVGEVEIYVPFNLVSVFPGTERLEDLVATARQVLLCETHPICLSGSATFLGKSVPISDLDFCEYFPSAIASMPALIAARLGAPLDKLLVRVNWNGTRFTAPFTDLEGALGQLANETVTYVKLDFLWSVPKYGMMPTTTMILKVNKNFSGRALQRSHVHQEAVISAAGPPRNLFGIPEISRYLKFLKKDIAKFVVSGTAGGSADSLKAMKRALSLLLLIGAEQDQELHSELEGLIDDLVSPAVEGIVVEKRLGELSELARDADAAIRKAALDEIDRIKLGFAGIMLDQNERDLVLQGASLTAAALNDMIDGLFSAAEDVRH